MSDAVVLGNRIRQLRTERPDPMTQEELAERAKISVSFLSMVERGQRTPHLAKLIALADALDVPVSEMFSVFDRRQSLAPDLLRPLLEFCERRALSRQDIEALVAVARVLFKNKVEQRLTKGA